MLSLSKKIGHHRFHFWLYNQKTYVIKEERISIIPDIQNYSISVSFKNKIYNYIIFESRNIDVLPDILSNSGGVIVSNYEYIQNKNIENEDNYASKEEILNRLPKQMKETFDIVYDHVQTKNITYKDACYGTALMNLEKKFKSKYNL